MNVRSFGFENASRGGDLRVNVAPLFLLDRFADGGKRFGFVTGVLAGGVHKMFEPWAARQTLFESELLLALHKRLIDFGDGCGCERSAAISDSFVEGRAIFGGSA